MLTWDEEVKPSLQNSPTGGFIESRATALSQLSSTPIDSITTRILNDGAPAPLKATVVAAANTSASAPAIHRRVKASDKRIINGQTDVNQLVPFKYKWAWEKYLATCATACQDRAASCGRAGAKRKDRRAAREVGCGLCNAD